MNDILIKLETYFNDAKRGRNNDCITAHSLAQSSVKAKEALREYQARTSSMNVKNYCDEIIAKLRVNEELIGNYSRSIPSGEKIGDPLIFIEINHVLYNALEEFLIRIGHL